ncbi:AAA domain (dynein-related subfamily) [Paenibacillus sp. cl141a]|uniref:McrB family protein n=1 Tax=Paenibacillus sp. cl141a TaxID=1761877 RepID=UPI0008D71344|nr:AAA family ATPase [Paenibacillus sp. cl141a]SEM24217.1 AAA domain (dynein-related subfamily) [Paenibacillus sp. cl141a]
MITQVRSWTHDDKIPNMIGRKKVDWSIFEYGSTIPNDFKTFFYKANAGEEIKIGKGKQVTLIYEDNQYQASLRNVDQKSAGRETLQLRYHSNDLKELMLTHFKHSFEYISARKPQDPGNKKQVVVPDELAEYLELYSTDIPYTYEMKLITTKNASGPNPNIWWVNQGATLSAEKDEGIIWAPLTGKGGRSQYHWDTMDEVKQGDIILHYANGSLRYVSRALEDCIHAEKPASMSNSDWNEEGRLVRVDYHELQPHVPLIEFSQAIMSLQIHQGPIHSGAGVKQGYLFRFNMQGLQVIQENAPEVEWPEFTNFKQITNKAKAVVTTLPKLEDTEIASSLEKIKSHITHQGFHYPDGIIENLYLSLKTKPFVILAGVSGTGKTKLVKLFAEAVGATKDNGQFALIPVRPDWSDPSDLLGYKDLSGVFRPGRLAEVLVEASRPENLHKPYFICLDEMNLARVEYYFSDILSVIETQEWKQDRIVTSALIHGESLLPEDRLLYGDLAIPDNVYLIGTVNMDETTHPFSKKVLDRANTIEFNYIDLKQYPEIESREEEALHPVHNSFLRSEYLQLVDVYSEYTELVQSTTDKLVKINHILEEIHSHVGFRIRDSICFYMIYNERFGLLKKEEAFDLQLLQKILPRVQGSSLSIKRVLLKLLEGALGEKLRINELLDDASEIYLKWNENIEEKKPKHPLSARKIAFMLRRLEEDGFTSYWLS